MSKSNDHYTGALLEDINHKFDLVLEAISPLSGVPDHLSSLETKVDNLIGINMATQAALKDFSAQVHGHETRLTTLETA